MTCCFLGPHSRLVDPISMILVEAGGREALVVGTDRANGVGKRHREVDERPFNTSTWHFM